MRYFDLKDNDTRSEYFVYDTTNSFSLVVVRQLDVPLRRYFIYNKSDIKSLNEQTLSSPIIELSLHQVVEAFLDSSNQFNQAIPASNDVYNYLLTQILEWLNLSPRVKEIQSTGLSRNQAIDIILPTI